RRGVDSIETQVARFRASGDSIDLFIASHLPVGSLKRDLATNVSNMRSAVFTVDASGTILSDQRSTISISGGARNSAVLRTQKHRTVTRAALARVELLEPDAE